MSEGSIVDNWLAVVCTGAGALGDVLEVHPAMKIVTIKSDKTVKIIRFFIISF